MSWPPTAEKQKSHRVRPGGSFALLRSDRQIYASGALPPGPMPPWKPDGCRPYDQVARPAQSRALANRAWRAWCAVASLCPRRIMTRFLEDEGIDPRRLTTSLRDDFEQVNHKSSLPVSSGGLDARRANRFHPLGVFFRRAV